MVPLLYSIIDFDSSPKTYERYDRMSARELFQMCASRVSIYELCMRRTCCSFETRRCSTTSYGDESHGS